MNTLVYGLYDVLVQTTEQLMQVGWILVEVLLLFILCTLFYVALYYYYTNNNYIVSLKQVLVKLYLK